MYSLSISNLSHSYGNIEILNKINLKVPQGEIISIIGPYGCGKSTLLKLIAGLIVPINGSIVINGKEKDASIGYCFQTPTLLPWLNVIDNILLPKKINTTVNREEALDLLKSINLDDKALYKPHEISGGTQKIVSILQSMIIDPEILLLDEPFSSIDELNREELQDQLLSIQKKRKKTTILVTHSLSEAVYLSDKVVVLTHKPAKIKRIITVDFKKRNESIRNSLEFFDYIISLRKELVNE